MAGLPPPLKVDFVECEKPSGFEVGVGAVHMASAASSRWSTWVKLGARTILTALRGSIQNGWLILLTAFPVYPPSYTINMPHDSRGALPHCFLHLSFPASIFVRRERSSATASTVTAGGSKEQRRGAGSDT
ncbi:hypothetical protein MUK42_37483 [Musa troglodytarum]|uniref:Uncharacterized protein n=1 Tax=Musa troglodytarum TaxID=320322 RepID=A0A9E7JA58_9LILI|nr:hypothetical protein MUK42_37483 [Musa troglodytarum]